MHKGGAAIIGEISGRNNQLKAFQKTLYDKARDTSGRSLPLKRSEFVNRVDNNLKRENLTAFLPAEVKTMINDIAYGQKGLKGQVHDVPFDVNSIDQLETILATAQRATKDGNVKQALSAVKKALLDTDIEGQASKESMKAFRDARNFSRKMYQWQEKIPAIKAIVEGVEPDQFMTKFILGSGDTAAEAHVRKLMMQMRGNKEVTAIVKGQVAAWIKDKAVVGNADELNILSQKGLKNALDKIGDRKLEAILGKEDLIQLKTIQRVASYEQAQPSGTAINNSNTATTATGMFMDWMDKLSNKIPGFELLVSGPAKNIGNWSEGAAAVVPNIGKQVSKQGPPVSIPLMLGVSAQE